MRSLGAATFGLLLLRLPGALKWPAHSSLSKAFPILAESSTTQYPLSPTQPWPVSRLFEHPLRLALCSAWDGYKYEQSQTVQCPEQPAPSRRDSPSGGTGGMPWRGTTREEVNSAFWDLIFPMFLSSFHRYLFLLLAQLLSPPSAPQALGEHLLQSSQPLPVGEKSQAPGVTAMVPDF